MATKSTGIAARLKKMKTAWKKAETKEGFSPVEDGVYAAKITGAVVCESAKRKELQIEWSFEILSDEAAGRKAKKWSGLEPVDQLEWTKGDFAKLDIDPDTIDISKIGDTLEELIGQVVELSFKTKEDYQNIYFNGLTDWDDEDEDEEYDEEEDAEESDDEDSEEEEEDDEDEEDDDEEEEEEEEDDEEEVDLDELNKKELLAFAKEYKLKIKGASKLTEKKLRAAIENLVE